MIVFRKLVLGKIFMFSSLVGFSIASFADGSLQKNDTHFGAGELEKVPRFSISRADAIQDKGLEDLIARASTPMSIIVLKGTTPRDAIKRICPSVSKKYFSVLGERFAEWNADRMSIYKINNKFNVDNIVKFNIEIFVPYCVESDDTEAVKFGKGDSLWELYNRQYGANPPNDSKEWTSFLKSVAEQNGRSPKSLSNIKAGEVLQFPKVTVDVPLSPSTTEQVGDWPQNSGYLGTKYKPSSRTPLWGVIDSLGENYDPSQLSDCEPKTIEAALDADREFYQSVANAQMQNRFVRERRNWSNSGNSARIALLDIGVVNHHHPFMRQFRFALSSRDKYRIDYQIAPPDYVDKHHGMSVLSGLAGGKLLAYSTSLFGAIEVAPYRILGSTRLGARTVHGMNATKALEALFSANKPVSDIFIVQLSARFTEPIEQMEQYIGEDKLFLFVTSAGNEGAQVSLTDSAFPASMGGEANWNLITVAAIDGNGELLPSSNFDPKHVDIGALGCNVAAVSVPEKGTSTGTRFETGTSFAAPRVSHVAAQLQIERHNQVIKFNPVDVKRRILFSADIKSNLTKKINGGRVLNAFKALSVYSDIVESRDGVLRSGRVKIGDAAQSIELCSDVIIERSHLRKIRHFDESELNEEIPRKFLIESEKNGNIKRDWCNSMTSYFEFENYLDEIAIKINLREVKDIVFASIPYWK